MIKYSSLPERFWVKVKLSGINDCWLWSAGKGNKYGVMNLCLNEKQKRSSLAHRVSWELCIGKIPDNLEIGHRCANRGCVNPKHLYITTPEENKIEMRNRRSGKVYIFPEPLSDRVVSQIRKKAISIQVRYKMKSIKFLESLSDGIFLRIHEILYNDDVSNEYEINTVEIMNCGHSSNYISMSSEGTSFCVMCAFLEEHKVNERIRKAIEQD